LDLGEELNSLAPKIIKELSRYIFGQNLKLISLENLEIEQSGIFYSANMIEVVEALNKSRFKIESLSIHASLNYLIPLDPYPHMKSLTINVTSLNNIPQVMSWIASTFPNLETLNVYTHSFVSFLDSSITYCYNDVDEFGHVCTHEPVPFNFLKKLVFLVHSTDIPISKVAPKLEHLHIYSPACLMMSQNVLQKTLITTHLTLDYLYGGEQKHLKHILSELPSLKTIDIKTIYIPILLLDCFIDASNVSDTLVHIANLTSPTGSLYLDIDDFGFDCIDLMKKALSVLKNKPFANSITSLTCDPLSSPELVHILADVFPNGTKNRQELMDLIKYT
jgi:hypothetical protein